jgi:hypothetical protein
MMTRILLWLFNKTMTLETFRYMRMHKYEIQKRK